MFMVIVVKMPETKEECEYFSNIQGCTRPKTPCKCTFYDAGAQGNKRLRGVRFCDSFVDMWSYQKLNLKTYVNGRGRGHTVKTDHSGLTTPKSNLETTHKKGDPHA